MAAALSAAPPTSPFAPPTLQFSFAIDMSWDNSWPLYTVYPLSTLFFVSFYTASDKIWLQLSPAYASRMKMMARMSWRQNTSALLHTVVLCPLLLVAILVDPELRVNRTLHPHNNIIGYFAICWSLGYFTFTIPWSYYLYFVKGERHMTNLPLCIHHAIVWVAALTYLLGRTCALYGAVAFAAMEFTNWFFIAHLLQQQARSKMKKLWTANYIVLIFVGVIGMRLVLCTYMFVLFSEDFSRFTSDSPAEWFFVVTQYAIFAMVVLLSWWFIWVGIKDAGLDQQAASLARDLLRKLGLDSLPVALPVKEIPSDKSAGTTAQKTPGSAVCSRAVKA